MSDHSLDRRNFFQTMGISSLGAVLAVPFATSAVAAEAAKPERAWKPVSDRKIRIGIVGYGVCQFGAAFGFQDHPNVEIVAVSDLFPERCAGLAKACRCEQTYASLEVLVQDPKIEAVFVATDAASHARHCREVLKHGKHVMTAVPATLGSIEEGERLLEAVKNSGLKYMMAETSCFHAACYAMRQIYGAGGFGRLVYAEGEYHHYMTGTLGSYKNWRAGLPPSWYPTHATAYYVGVTGQRLTSVSCHGFRGPSPIHQPGANQYNNPFTDEISLFQTGEGGTFRMCRTRSIHNLISETGRVFGERGWMDETGYHGAEKQLPDTARPPIPPQVPEGGHGGSHGRLTHEFITAILEDREPLVNIYEALAMTVPGIIAHQSALKDGETLKVPQFNP